MIRIEVLIKRNIVALLKARRLQQQDLAQHCRRDVDKKKAGEWLSKILNSERHNLPLEYWGRVADFFKVEPYVLLQPGVAAESERRRGGDRRAFQDRRMSRRTGTPEPYGDLREVWDQIRTMDDVALKLLRDFLASLPSRSASTRGHAADTPAAPAGSATAAQRSPRRRHHG